MKFLLPTFIVLPILEIYLLIEVGSYIGALNTIGLIALTAILGFVMLRQQGFKTLANATIKLQQFKIPAEEMLTGFFLAIGGVLLITPGFITDIFGFVFLLPFSRRILLRFLNLTFFRWTGLSSQEKNTEKDWIEGNFKREK